MISKNLDGEILERKASELRVKPRSHRVQGSLPEVCRDAMMPTDEIIEICCL